MQIQDLKKSFNTLGDKERLAMILDIRLSRRTSKRSTKAKTSGKTTSTSKPKKDFDLDSLLKSMPKDKLKELLLGG